MESKLNFVFISDKVALNMVKQNRMVLDLLPTDQKYSAEFEDLLVDEYGYGFISEEKEESYEIPDYIEWHFACGWKAMNLTYQHEPYKVYPELNSPEPIDWVKVKNYKPRLKV